MDHEAGETEAAHIGMNQRLTEYPEVDHQMDRYQETGYSYLERIVKHSVDPWARRAARQALAAFRRAEELETVNETHVEASREELVKAREHNHNVIGIAEENRRPRVHANGLPRRRLRHDDPSVLSLSHKADISRVSMFCIPSFDEMTDLTPYLNHVIPAYAGIQTVSHSANQVEGTSETGSTAKYPIAGPRPASYSTAPSAGGWYAKDAGSTATMRGIPTTMSCNPMSCECFVGSHRKCSGEVPHLSIPPTPCQCECHAGDRELVAA